ncbi:hypothetical protein BT63DRAFT_452242 [Microthyrium microscopicum]|uniref:Uncharacterized protein n=1 Tax=Microthyrium microscopicum TaxID=703497 RepID=A0A6A6UHJ0_9PEZI|nr:hypothetical protein BT63DRAFT_452242 [Microthyrium microscopicum]
MNTSLKFLKNPYVMKTLSSSRLRHLLILELRRSEALPSTFLLVVYVIYSMPKTSNLMVSSSALKSQQAIQDVLVWFSQLDDARTLSPKAGCLWWQPFPETVYYYQVFNVLKRRHFSSRFEHAWVMYIDNYVFTIHNFTASSFKRWRGLRSFSHMEEANQPRKRKGDLYSTGGRPEYEMTIMEDIQPECSSTVLRSSHRRRLLHA